MDWIIGFAILIVKLGVVLVGLLLLAAYLVLLERKFLGRLQIRYGPNRAGKFGLLQPLADTIKMLTKEDIVPEAADRALFLLRKARGRRNGGTRSAGVYLRSPACGRRRTADGIAWPGLMVRCR